MFIVSETVEKVPTEDRNMTSHSKKVKKICIVEVRYIKLFRQKKKKKHSYFISRLWIQKYKWLHRYLSCTSSRLNRLGRHCSFLHHFFFLRLSPVSKQFDSSNIWCQVDVSFTLLLPHVSDVSEQKSNLEYFSFCCRAKKV